MPNLGTTEIIIIALVVLVLFGSKKLPDAARSFGRSLRIFKAETKGLRDDDASAAPAAPAAPAPAAQPVAPLPIESRPAAPAATSPSVNGVAPVDAERR
ncbi:twin-arginine translocation protein, TatA/E family subunit [Parafrankia sp. EAN1pec]|uniref:Sec-independent protein translocase subunit TatA n=1 Tax=Parafrankia sp. (strain EAN1pec) TaxID=298653 RepID=UPI0000541440|nr:twin-arginine translocation protein, TatA/E family subunit [Frankia sp. EAN1pec]